MELLDAMLDALNEYPGQAVIEALAKTKGLFAIAGAADKYPSNFCLNRAYDIQDGFQILRARNFRSYRRKVNMDILRLAPRRCRKSFANLVRKVLTEKSAAAEDDNDPVVIVTPANRMILVLGNEQVLSAFLLYGKSTVEVTVIEVGDEAEWFAYGGDIREKLSRWLDDDADNRRLFMKDCSGLLRELSDESGSGSEHSDGGAEWQERVIETVVNPYAIYTMIMAVSYIFIPEWRMAVAVVTAAGLGLLFLLYSYLNRAEEADKKIVTEKEEERRQEEINYYIPGLKLSCYYKRKEAWEKLLELRASRETLIKALTENLRNIDPDIVKFAAHRLTDLADAELIESIELMLNDPSFTVRQAAREVVYAWKSKNAAGNTDGQGTRGKKKSDGGNEGEIPAMDRLPGLTRQESLSDSRFSIYVREEIMRDELGIGRPVALSLHDILSLEEPFSELMRFGDIRGLLDDSGVNEGIKLAVRLYALYLLADAKHTYENRSILNMVGGKFVPLISSFERAYAFYGPIGTEVEVMRATEGSAAGSGSSEELFDRVEMLGGEQWETFFDGEYADPAENDENRGYPCLAVNDDFDAASARKISVFAGIGLGKDEKIEYAFPPSYSWFTQAVIIVLMRALGMIPQYSWSSLHINTLVSRRTAGLRETDRDMRGLKYIELIKMLLFASAGRLSYIAEGEWFPLAFKPEVMLITNKLPSVRSLNESILGIRDFARFEYRTAEVGTDDDCFIQSIRLTQVFHYGYMHYLNRTDGAGYSGIDNGMAAMAEGFLAEMDALVDRHAGLKKYLSFKWISGMNAFTTNNPSGNGILGKLAGTRVSDPEMMRAAGEIVLRYAAGVERLRRELAVDGGIVRVVLNSETRGGILPRIQDINSRVNWARNNIDHDLAAARLLGGEELLGAPQHTYVWFANVDGESAGYVMVSVNKLTGDCLISYLAVAKEYRRNGFAGRLLEEAFRFAASMGRIGSG
jgi:hypothetical protein